MNAQTNCAVILAAGQGKRMKSDIPKVLCEVLGKPMVDYVVAAVKGCVNDICVVVGYKADDVKSHLEGGLEYAYQHETLGTAHAVMMAEDFIKKHKNSNVIILCGDAPFMDETTVKNALELHIKEDNAVTVITANLENPANYGRVIRKDGFVSGIIEYKDANEETRQITEINSGTYWFKTEALLQLLPMITNNNAQNEYYLTDTVKHALQLGMKVNGYISASPDVVLGANDAESLAELNEIARRVCK